MSHKSTRPKQDASDLAGETRGTGSAGSIQLCPSSLSPLWKPGMSSFTYADLSHCYQVPLQHMHAPPLSPYLAISAPVFCWSWFVLPARAASASFRQALSPTWEGAAGNKGQGYLFARQNSQAAPPPQHSTLIEALQALKDSYKHYFSSVCEPPLKATEMKSSLWQKILFWYTCIRKTFIWRWHRISAKVCLLIQVGYQKPQRKTHSWKHLFSVHISAFADLILPRKKNVTKK